MCVCVPITADLQVFACMAKTPKPSDTAADTAARDIEAVLEINRLIKEHGELVAMQKRTMQRHRELDLREIGLEQREKHLQEKMDEINRTHFMGKASNKMPTQARGDTGAGDEEVTSTIHCCPMCQRKWTWEQVSLNEIYSGTGQMQLDFSRMD